MAVLKDYKCDKHGYFESREPKCPMKNCSEEVYVVFLQAPALMSDATKKNDRNVKQLAIDFNMTDIKSTREGEHQSGYHTRNNAPTDLPYKGPGQQAMWGGDNRFSMSNLLRGNAIRPIRDEAVSLNPKAVGNLTGPKAASYIADHENLALKK